MIKEPIYGLTLIVLKLIAPVTALLVLPFIKWDKEESVGPRRTNIPTPTIMGELPSWLSWIETPDQRLPCDTGIPECKSILDTYGKYVAAWNWLGIRNTWMGLANWLGKPTSGYIPEDVEGFWERNDQLGNVWIYRKTIGNYRIYTGYTAYALIDGTFNAAPILTIKYGKSSTQ